MKKEEKVQKITEEQLSTIKSQQEEIAQLLKEIGFLESQKHGLMHKYAGVIQDSEEFKATLEKEYGAINISLEDGSYNIIEKEKTDSE
jgi:hypothetical protein